LPCRSPVTVAGPLGRPASISRRAWVTAKPVCGIRKSSRLIETSIVREQRRVNPAASHNQPNHDGRLIHALSCHCGRPSTPPSGSLLITDVEVQAAACADRVDQGLQLRWRGRLGPCLPPAPQRDPGGKPGAYRAQRPRPGRRRRQSGGARPPSLRGRGPAAERQQRPAAAGFRRTRRPSRSRTRS